MNELKKDVLIKNNNPHDDYDLIQQVGSGTYGQVYKAKCHATNQLAAIKIIKIEDQEDFESIESEIRLMKACVHPNIVAFYGSYIRRDKLWICMEFCGGGSLQDIYHATGPLPENIIAFVCREVLRGLNYLHVSRNILHRDVKITANILLSDHADVKLADFGVSAQITTTMNCKRRTFIGTPFWMAPEVAAVDRKGGYNQSCDIWSVGITAIELAELQPPLYDLHPMRALYIMSKSGFKPPTLKSKEKWSPIFHDFIKVALTKSPKKRPNAERLLTHQFVRCTIDRRLIINLIEKSRNPPNRYNLVLNELDPEDELELDLPSRITSKKSFKSKPESPDNRQQQQQQYQPLRSQICKIVDSDSVNNQNYEKNLINNNKLVNRPSSSSSNNQDSLESWMNSQQKDQYQKSLLEIVDEELLQRGHKSLTTLDKEFKSTLTKTTIGQFASYINEPLAGCNRLSNNSITFGQGDILNNSSINYQMIDHNLSNYNVIKEQVEHNQHQSIDYHVLTKPQMQFDFLKEKYLIDTDLTNISETNTPNDYEFKNFLFNKNDDDDDDDVDKTIEEKLSSEHFEDYQSDNFYQLDNIIECDDDDDHNKFEEATDNLIDLYASAISGLLINNNDSNKNNNRIDLKRREIQNRVDKFKNRFSQQLDYSSIVNKNQNSLELSKSKDDYFINSNLNEQKKWSNNIENDNSDKKSNNLKDNLDKLNKQITLLDEQKYITTNNNLITNHTNNNTNQQNYEDKLAELSDWSIDTIETLINELCKEEKLNEQPSAKSSNDKQFNISSNDNDGELEFSTPPSTPKSPNSSPNDSLNKTNNQSTSYQYSTAKQNLTKQDLLLSQKYDQSSSINNNNQPPSAPPRTRRKQGSLLASKSDSSSSFSSSNKSNDNSKQNQQRLTNGLPPTPKVHMGACFSKVFNKCPLKINCCVNWVNQVTRDEHLLFGCDEGIYTLNMNELHDACLDQLFPRITTWMYVIGNTLMSISGKTRHLYCHDVLQLHNRILQNKDHNTKLSQTMDQVINRIPDKFTPWRVSCTTKISSSRGVKHCCVVHNKSNGYKYLAGATENIVFLMQWYNPLNKFMLLKQYELQLPLQIRVFEMIISPDVEYPLLCIGAKRCRQPNKIQLDLINLNSSSSWFSNEFGDGQETVIPKNQVLNLICVRQIDKDAILICYENIVRIVNLKGELKNSKKYISEIIFEFNIDSLVYLTDSVLAFHKHGMVGKSLKNCEITQEITDRSGFYRVLNMESKTITLECKVPDDVLGPSNLYVLTGHTDSESSF